jgi:hypothetical protein
MEIKEKTKEIKPFVLFPKVFYHSQGKHAFHCGMTT